MIRRLAAFGLAPLASACATVAEAAALAGTRWTVVAINGQAANGSIAFTADRLSGDFGCNRLSGGYRLER
jgi:heat shock protein HslJ